MRQGVVLALEAGLENHIRKVWKSFEEAGIGITPGQLLEPPHITIAEAASTAIEPFWQAAIETPFTDQRLQLLPFGVFLAKKNVLFYNVTLSEGLHRSYLAFYDLLRNKKAAYKPLYDPSHLLFHCTVAIDIEESELSHAIELMSKERATLSGIATAIELWEHHPARRKNTKLLQPTPGAQDPGILE